MSTEHDTDHLARLILAQTRVRVGTVTGTLTGFRSGQYLQMVNDDATGYELPWGLGLLQLEKIDRERLARAQAAQDRQNAAALRAKRAVAARPDYPGMTGEQVADAVRAELANAVPSEDE